MLCYSFSGSGNFMITLLELVNEVPRELILFINAHYDEMKHVDVLIMTYISQNIYVLCVYKKIL